MNSDNKHLASSPPLAADDFRYLEQQGIGRATAEAQLRHLAQPPAARRLVAPCTLTDGVIALDRKAVDDALRNWDRYRGAERFETWIPSSGAASRMFGDLAAGDPHALAALKREIERFPFARSLLEATDGDLRAEVLARALVEEPLGYGDLPKALIPFHSYSEGARTALEEHVAEARLYGREVPRLTFTVSPEHRALFERARRGLPSGECKLRFSEQSRASSTLALDIERGEVIRDAEGRPALRPGGHGALLENLDRAASGHLLVRNIDNVQPARLHGEVARWKKVLGGVALGLATEVDTALRQLADNDLADADFEAVTALLRRLGLAGEVPRQHRRLRSLLDRPLRVCGVVRNEGEPGGGPFRVRLPNGEVRSQIVESAEVDHQDPEQAEMWAASTHFNPVDIACILERSDGSRYSLAEFCDSSAVFVNQRLVDGRQARVLERPGLWNGGMALWHTVFVEVPRFTFTPVKSVFDLLRPEHRAESGC